MKETRFSRNSNADVTLGLRFGGFDIFVRLFEK
jgi:hypothetical protein